MSHISFKSATETAFPDVKPAYR